MIAGGRGWIRSVLYMSTVVAVRRNLIRKGLPLPVSRMITSWPLMSVVTAGFRPHHLDPFIARPTGG